MLHLPKKMCVINKEINTTLFTSSQKDLDIEKSSHPGAQIIGGGGGGGVTKAKSITPYVRKKKGVKTKIALGEHTHHIFETSSLENVLHSSSSTPLDASQINAEMQPHSLSIQPSSPHSTSQISSDIVMIDNFEISNSPSLRLMGEPKIQIDTHHSEKNDFVGISILHFIPGCCHYITKLKYFKATNINRYL